MKPVTVAAFATLTYSVVGLVVLDPHTLFSVDAAVKLLQARSLIETGLRSLSLPYPAASLDAAFEFFPFAPPFVFKAGNSWQGVFSSGVALFNAAWLLLGVGGVVLASAVAGGITLGVMSSLETKAPRWAVPLVLGIGTNFWFYCVLPWEHVPALALSSAAWVMLFRGTRRRTLVAAAAAFGAAVVLREESLLLLPGFLWALWVTRRDLRALAIFTLVLAAPLCLLSAADVLLFHRPPAAHLAHVSELLAGSVRGGSSLPVRDAWPVTERAETIVQQWVLGREGWSFAIVVMTLFAAATVFRRRPAAALVVLTLAMLCLVQAGQDLVAMLPHPDFLPGLLRLSPVLLFALTPPASGEAVSLVRRLGLLTSAGYVLGLLGSLSTGGGASLGPRLLLPILPMLCHAACEGLWSYRSRHASRQAWPVWQLGLLLLAGSIVMQVGVAMRAYVTFNAGERRAVTLLQSTHDDVIVIDSVFTMSVTEPVYGTKRVMMADSPSKSSQLGGLLERRAVPSFLLVSRELTQPLDFAPYRLVSAEHFPRTTIQRWVLGADRGRTTPEPTR